MSPRTAGLTALWLGLGSVAGVACLRLPGLLTAPQVRGLYAVPVVRGALVAALVASVALALWALWRGEHKRPLVALLAAAVAGTLGGPAAPVGAATAGVGWQTLDWLAIDGLLLALVVAPLERKRPRVAARGRRAEWKTDLRYFVMNHLSLHAVTALSTAAAGLAVYGLGLTHLHGVVDQWPVVVQLLAIALVADGVQYALHRAMHEVPWLWRIHAVHHSSRHMDALAGSRVHVIETLLTRVGVALPLFVLGFSFETVLLYGGLMVIQSTLLHANIDLRYGGLERWLVSARYHHWHHSSEDAAIDTNYAAVFPFIDRLFGTHHLPSDAAWPARYGVVKEDVPDGLWAQQLFPLRSASRG